MKPIDFKRLDLNKQFARPAVVGAIILRHLKAFFDDQSLFGVLKNDKFFLSTQNQAIKIELFKNKRLLITEINKKLETLGYTTKINDIYIRSLQIQEDDEEYI